MDRDRVIREAQMSMSASFIGAIIDQYENRGRLQRLLAVLYLEMHGESKKMPLMTPEEYAACRDSLDSFDNVSGWVNQGKHMMTYITFVTRLTEVFGNRRITETLADIVDYLFRQNKNYSPCIWAGNLAWEKWQKISENIK